MLYYTTLYYTVLNPRHHTRDGGGVTVTGDAAGVTARGFKDSLLQRLQLL